MFFFQAEDGIRDAQESRGLGDVYKRQNYNNEVITASSTGATSKTVTCSGEVFTATAVPFCHWNFNTNPPTSPANWTAPIASNSGTGSLTYTFDYATSYTGETLNAAFGDAAGGSFAPVAGTNQVNNGEEFVMTVDTSGRENIVMTYATRGTSTGFTTQEIYYSCLLYTSPSPRDS